jgi:hypothetical protein
MEVLESTTPSSWAAVTYEPLGSTGGVSGDPHMEQSNAMPKYVASQSLTDVTWNVAENLFQRR